MRRSAAALDEAAAAPTRGGAAESASAPRQPAPRRKRKAERFLAGRGWTVTCLVADAVALLVAIAAALFGADEAAVDAAGGAVIWFFPPIVITLLAVRGMYRSKVQTRLLDEAVQVIAATSVAAMSLIAVAAFSSTAQPAPLLARVWLFGTAYVAGTRLVLIFSQRRARSDRAIAKPTLIVGAGWVGAQVERRLELQPDLGLQPVGYLDADPPPPELAPGRRAPVLGSLDDLVEIAQRVGAQHVVLAFMGSRGSDERMIPFVRTCTELGLEVSLVPRLFESINVRIGLEHLGGMPLFQLRSIDPKGWQFAAKHALDRLIAGVILLLLSPVVLLAALAVRISSAGPVFFRQRRVGLDGEPFDLLKFRSMRQPDKGRGSQTATVLTGDSAPGGVEGKDRRTAIGKLLRRSSIDELPQLLNVLRGEMSLVGPRPERPEFVELFGERIRRYDDRHRVRAGITGWAQVHGLRGNTSLSDRIEWDNYYIANWSLQLDLKIMLMTVTAIFRAAD